jgi:signal peptidase
MEPEIPTGSLAFVDTEFRDLSEGTVIAYRMGGTVVTHRVSEVLTDGYRTRGDANEQPDGQLVSPDQVIGTVHLVIPCLGYLIVWIQSEKGRILTGILLAVYLICLYFRTGKNNQKENIRKCKKGRRAESILRKKSNENEKINCKNNGTV